MPGPATSPPSKGAVVFLHAHPDDEAIFTGGTLRLLADAGWRTVVVVRHRGELGAPPRRAEGEATAGPDEVADVRADESQVAAVELGVAKVHFLDFADSGLPTGHGFVPAPGSLAAAPLDEVTDRVAEILVEEQAETVVTYDVHGIYGHPDHIVVHRAACWPPAAAASPPATRPPSTASTCTSWRPTWSRKPTPRVPRRARCSAPVAR